MIYLDPATLLRRQQLLDAQAATEAWERYFDAFPSLAAFARRRADAIDNGFPLSPTPHGGTSPEDDTAEDMTSQEIEDYT